jgi:hypothetical protein
VLDVGIIKKIQGRIKMEKTIRREIGGGLSKSIWLLAIMIMALVLLPVTAMMSTPADTVYVSVMNETYSKAEGAPWDGVLIDREAVEIEAGDTMMDAISKALAVNEIEAEGMESNYISSINGLGQFDGIPTGGWMGTLNDWFVNEGIDGIVVEDGDLIEVQYSCDYGVDLGGDWENNETTLKALEFNLGDLEPAFSSGTTEYTLMLPEGTEEVVVTPTATNKNFQVRTYLDTYDADSVGYKRTAAIPVVEGSKIIIGVGDPAWPGMNESTAATKYTVSVQIEQAMDPEEQKAQDIQALLDTISESLKGSGTNWDVMDMAAYGMGDSMDRATLMANALNIYNKSNLQAATEYERVAIALTSLGINARAVDNGEAETADFIEKIANYKKDAATPSLGTINSYIFALLAYDAGNYNLPEGSYWTREKVVTDILAKQLADGGWALSGTKADPDVTGMAVSALANYQDDTDVATALTEAINCLSDMQTTNGGFKSWGTENSGSTSMVIVALSAMGIDADKDARFVKEGKSAIDALLSYKTTDNRLGYNNTNYNAMATEQGFRALVAYTKYLNTDEAYNIYVFGDMNTPDPEPNTEAAEAVINLINALPDPVQLSDKGAVEAARGAYNDLTQEEQGLVPQETLNKLIVAEARIEALEGESESGITVSVSSKSVKEGETVVVPINVKDALGLAGGQFTLTFDPKVALPTKVELGALLAAGFNLQANLNNAEEGSVRIAFAGSNGVNGEGVLLNVTFQAVGAAGSSTQVNITDLKLNDEESADLTATAEAGQIDVESSVIYGDASGDGEVTAGDATQVLKHVVGLTTLNENQKLAGDVNGDGKISAADATLILRYVVDLINQFPVQK